MFNKLLLIICINNLLSYANKFGSNILLNHEKIHLIIGCQICTTKNNLELIYGAGASIRNLNILLIGSSSKEISLCMKLGEEKTIKPIFGVTYQISQNCIKFWMGIELTIEIKENMELNFNGYITSSEEKQSKTIEIKEPRKEEKWHDYSSLNSSFSNTDTDDKRKIKSRYSESTHSYVSSYQPSPTKPTIKKEQKINDEKQIIPMKTEKEIQKFQRLCLYNFFHRFCPNFLTFIRMKWEVSNIQNEMNKNQEEIKTKLKTAFSKCINELTPIALKYQLNPNIKVTEEEKDKISQILKEILDPLQIKYDINKELQFITQEIYQKESDAIKIQSTMQFKRKAKGVKCGITNLHINYRKTSHIFSYPAFESAESKEITTDLRSYRKIQSDEEYLKNKRKEREETDVEYLNDCKRLDNSFNYNLLLKEILLQMPCITEIMYAYTKDNHTILIIEKKGKEPIKIDSNKITINNFCQNLNIQTGGNCCVFVVYLGILTKILGNIEHAIKAFIGLNQLYHKESNKSSNVENYLLKILNIKEISAEEQIELYQKLQSLIKMQKRKHLKFFKYKSFGDFLRIKLVEIKFNNQFEDIKNNMQLIQKIIKNEKQIEIGICNILNHHETRIIQEKNPIKFLKELKYFVKKFLELLKSDIQTVEIAKKIYEEIFERPSKEGFEFPFLGDQLFFAIQMYNKKRPIKFIQLAEGINIEDITPIFNLLKEYCFIGQIKERKILVTNEPELKILEINNHIEKSDYLINLMILSIAEILSNDRVQYAKLSLKIVQILLKNLFQSNENIRIFIKNILNETIQEEDKKKIETLAKKYEQEEIQKMQATHNQKTVLKILKDNDEYLNDPKLQKLKNEKYMLKQIMNIKIHQLNVSNKKVGSPENISEALKLFTKENTMEILQELEEKYNINNIFEELKYPLEKEEDQNIRNAILYKYTTYYEESQQIALLPILFKKETKITETKDLIKFINFKNKVVFITVNKEEKVILNEYSKREINLIDFTTPIIIIGKEYTLKTNNVNDHILISFLIMRINAEINNLKQSTKILLSLIVYWNENRDQFQQIIKTILEVNKENLEKFLKKVKGKESIIEESIKKFCQQTLNFLIENNVITKS